MASVQKPKSIPHSNPKYQSQTINSQTKSRLQYERSIESDSQSEQNQRIVDELFGDRNKLVYDDTEEDEHEEDEDIKRFLEQQVPGLYKGRQYEENSDEEPEMEHNLSISFSSSISSQYLTMSRFQKQSYFDNLNAEYMDRMNMNNNKSSYGSDDKIKDQRRKPAIKFNQIVFEVPFNKDEQPMIVKHTPQEEAFIVFDDAAYDSPDDQQERESIRVQKEIVDMNDTNIYFDQMDEDEDQEEEEEEYMRQQILERYCKQRLQYIEQINGQNNDIFTESDEEDQSSSQSPQQSSSQSPEQSSSQSPEQQKIATDNQLTPKPSVQQLQSTQRKWKRNAKRQFIDEVDNSESDDSSSVDESSSEEKPSKFQSSIPLLLQKVQSSHPALSDQFIEGIQGRKINPNALSETKYISETKTENKSSQDQHESQPQSEPQSQPESQPQSQPQSQLESQPQSQPESHPDNIVTQTTTQNKLISTS